MSSEYIEKIVEFNGFLGYFISSASDRKNKIKQLYNTIQRNEKHQQTFVHTVRHKKLHHFVYAITLSYLYLFEYLFWYTYTVINLEQTGIKIINLI